MPREEEPEKELAHDLRQSFALIINGIKQQIVIARNNQDFSNWYLLLDSLFIEVSKNLTEEEVKEYEELKAKGDKIFKELNKTFLKKSTLKSDVVYNNLRILDMWINKKMNEKNMFGSRESFDDGL